MATYLELRNEFNNSDLRNKVEVAICEAARIIAAGEDDAAPWSQVAGAHDNRVKWAARALNNTGNERDRILKLVLVQNKAFTVAQINGATDTAVQNNVNQMVDLLATGDITGA